MQGHAGSASGGSRNRPLPWSATRKQQHQQDSEAQVQGSLSEFQGADARLMADAAGGNTPAHQHVSCVELHPWQQVKLRAPLLVTGQFERPIILLLHIERFDDHRRYHVATGKSAAGQRHTYACKSHQWHC